MVHHFKTIQWRKRERSLKSTPSKTPSQQRWKPCPPKQTPAASIFFYETDTHQTPPSSLSLQWLYSPRSPLYSPPASLPSRESSVEPHSEDSSPTGSKRHQSETAFIRPHNIDRGLTPGLSALLQEMSPLAPYKLERSAKARARQAFSTMRWTPFKTLQRKSVN